MTSTDPNRNDPAVDEPLAPAEPDPGDVTPPHGDEVAGELRNASRHDTPSAADPDNDRPSR